MKKVAFFTTSARLRQACDHALKRNKTLARHATIRDLMHAGSTGAGKGTPGLQMVMLSHADEDHHILTEAKTEPLVSKAFHLLVTEPATHPDQVAQWIRGTNIRSEDRLHIVKVAGLEDPKLSELLGRVCHAFAPEDKRGSIIDAYLRGDTLLVRGSGHRMLHVPIASIPALRDQPQDCLRNFEIDADGSFVYWPDIDVHLGWDQFLQAVDPSELRKAKQRSADFNRRYGAAIRKIREDARIPQIKVDGITERQLRRIEQGECRATSNALRKLAAAHRLDVNDYLEKVATAMS